MGEIGTLTTILASINQAIGIGRALKDVDKTFDAADFKLKMSEMIEKLVDAKIHLQENREENLKLREEILRLSQALAQKESVVFEEGKYWKVLSDGKKEGPFCQKCKDTDNKIVWLQKDNIPSRGDYWRCTTCNQVYDYPRNVSYGQRETQGLSNWM